MLSPGARHEAGGLEPLKKCRGWMCVAGPDPSVRCLVCAAPRLRDAGKRPPRRDGPPPEQQEQQPQLRPKRALQGAAPDEAAQDGTAAPSPPASAVQRLRQRLQQQLEQHTSPPPTGAQASDGVPRFTSPGDRQQQLEQDLYSRVASSISGLSSTLAAKRASAHAAAQLSQPRPGPSPPSAALPGARGAARSPARPQPLTPADLLGKRSPSPRRSRPKSAAGLQPGTHAPAFLQPLHAHAQGAGGHVGRSPARRPTPQGSRGLQVGSAHTRQSMHPHAHTCT